MRTIFYAFLTSLLSIFLLGCKTENNSKIRLSVSVSDSLYNKPISGKILILFNKDTSAIPVYGPNPFNPQPFFRIDFKNWDTKSPLQINTFDNWWTMPIDSLFGNYVMQIVIDVDTTERGCFAKGNIYSSRQIIQFKKDSSLEINTTINQWIPYWSFRETKFLKEELFQSKFLTDFWNSPMYIKAGVLLPKSYFKNPEKKYKIVYVFPGFGSSHATISLGDGQINRYGMNTVGEEKIFVFCNGEFFQGYHHFADSENNGPWGKAFTGEFIPYIESKYRVINNQRFLMGQSSGAWTSIWLQINYPDLFSASFAASPDPIDFRATGNNIYMENANFYFSRKKDSVSIKNSEFTKQMALMERNLNEYGQFLTWESTYSKIDKSGKPFQLFDRETGEINPEVAEQWKKYDIALIIQSKPEFYKEKLKDKLHIFVSNDDDYGLYESVRLFKNVSDSLGIETDVQFLNNLGHNVWTDDLRKYIHNIIDNS